MCRKQKIKAGQLKTADVDSNAIEFINYVEGKYNTQIERCGVDDAYYTNNKRFKRLAVYVL